MKQCLQIFVIVSLISFSFGAKSKYVSMNVDTKWADTPLILEASEYLALESNEKFWEFVNKVADFNSDTFGDDEESQYNRIFGLVAELVTPLQLSLMKFALSIRAHSPRVEMFNQVGWDKISPKSCDAFIDVNNLITCDENSIKNFISDAQGQPKPLTIKSDHHYPGTEFINTTVILYAELGTQTFQHWHNVLKQLAEKREVNYIVRHYISNPSDRRVRLSGYGVELAIKSQEYKAKDDTKLEDSEKSHVEEVVADDDIGGFNFAQLRILHPDLLEDLDKFKQHLLNTNNELPELKVWQLQDLSYQAGQTVMSVEQNQQLQTLRDISQNFPSQMRHLVKISVTDEFRKEVKKNQNVWENKLGLRAGDSAMFINGIQADLDTYDVFTLLDTLKSEATVMEGLHALEMKGDDLSNILKLELSDADSNYALDYRDPTIVYLNDLEKDRRYQGWPSSVTEMLRPTFPGMLRHIRKNFFTTLFIVDPSNINQRELIKMAEAFYVHSAPIRMAVLFVVNSDPEVNGYDDAGVAMYRAFNYLSKEERPIKAIEFITEIYNKAENKDITPDLVFEALHDLRPHTVSKDDILGPNGAQYDKNRKESAATYERMGLGELPQVLMNGVPMKADELQADNFEDSVVSNIMTLTPDIQKAVYNGLLYDGMDVTNYIMTRSNVMPRLNTRILSTASQYLDLTHSADSEKLNNPEEYSALPNSLKTGALISSMKYLTKKEEPSIRSLSNWIVADLDQPEGRNLVYDALKNLKSCGVCRLGIVHNPTVISDTDSNVKHFISKAVHVALQVLPSTIAKSFITKLMKEENVKALSSGEKTLDDLSVNNMDMELYHKELKKLNIVKVLQSHQIFTQFVLSFSAGDRGVIANGKVIGPLKENEKFLQDDFSLLEKYCSKTSAGKIEKVVKKMGWEPEEASDLIMKIASLLLSAPVNEDSRKETPYHSSKHRYTVPYHAHNTSAIILPPKNSNGPAYDVVAILDPSTRAAQKYTPLIMVLNEVTNSNIKVFLNCREKLSEMPLKSYYRYVLEPEVKFHSESKLSLGPSAVFRDLPSKPILTLVVDTPESWLVESVRSVYDLDNIHLEDIDSAGVHSDFELEHLLLEGHCFDSQSGQPPRGLQFILGTNNKPAQVDTIVMANLGYFQLKAAPGLWDLELREGRSKEIYEISSHEYTDSPSDSKQVRAVMDSFKSKIIKVRVAKQPGKEKEKLLSDKEEPSGGFWDSLSSQFGGGDEKKVEDVKDDAINIFSLASGHLYERFMRIMISSVMKTTQSKVKFWFLKNYLSPSFKDFIPYLAEELKFEYEFVQYKWPRWLHQQTEKQRVMWGYKILFLDVLFPLNINKIIFVDADQIVRTDLQELIDLDLEGAPYGYTPFCDSRTEMDGFRFWKSGYWNSHLAGRKYHISALYVVDLKQFRKIAAGDRLRGQYQGLSQDPNSLSNLDQDLPNNMIHQVPIKSLPQEWLWCETWCSDAEKASAKTIDLCNNPLTKEPKLTAAQRIVPEWIEYDNQVKQLWDRVYKKSKTTSGEETAQNTDTHDHKEL